MDGDRSPTDSAAERIDRAVAASASSRSAAIDAAFSQFSDIGDDGVISARTSHRDDEGDAGDDRPAAPPPVKSPAPDQGGEEPAEGNDKPAPDGQQSQPASKDSLDAPKHWPKDRRDQFAMLPDEAKRIILERNKEANIAVTKAQQEAAQARRTHEAYSGLFTDDHKRQMREAGMDELGAVRYLVQQHDALNRDPVGFIKAVIANAGIKPEQLFGPQAPGQQQPAEQPPAEADWEDPAVALIRKEVAKLQERETARERAAEQHRQSEQQRFNRWFAEQCDAFENAIGEDGNPKYPHLPAVINDVIRLVQSDPAAKSLLLSRPAEALEKAYNQALYLHPEIRQQLIDADLERRMSEREAQNAVKKAQAAATRKGSPGASGQAQVGRMSREDAINKAMRDAGL